MIVNVSVLSSNMVFDIFCQFNGSLVVFINGGWSIRLPRSFIKQCSHIASCVAEHKATYSASVEDLVTADCFLLDELTVPLPN